MIKISTLIILFFGLNALSVDVVAQANPSVAILPLNAGGVVAAGAVMDVKVTILNTSAGIIVASKLRPVITIPALATILPTAQQTGLPPGWVIVSNAAGQIRVCNASDIMGGNSQRDIIIKVQGTTIGGPTQCAVNLFFGGATCAVSGPQPSGNIGVDDFATSSITVVAGCSLSVSATAGVIECNGGLTTITATATNTSGPVEFSLTDAAPYQTSNVFINVLPGSYTVTARDIANPTTCVAISTLLILNNPAAIPAPTVNIVQPTCTLPNGVFSITSATTNLTFSLDGNPNYNIYSGVIFLAAGAHTVRAKNTNNCLSPITNFTINDQPVAANTPVPGTITQPNCTISTGSVLLQDLPAGNWIINPGNISGNSSSFTVNSLVAGTYNFTVTNAAGCSSLPTSNIIINAVQGAPTAPVIALTQPSCTVAAGSLLITSATVGLSFSLDGGAYQVYPAVGFMGLYEGNHNLIARNIDGCLSAFTNFIIRSQPTSPIAPAINIQEPTCTVATGVITITSATLNTTFSLNSGPFMGYPLGGFIVPPGTHRIAAQNSNGCLPSATDNIIVNSQPLSPTATLSATAITCSGENSTLTVVATGAVLPYEYSLNNGAYQTSAIYTVVAGSYIATVKDANGCSAITSNLNIAQPTAISAALSSTAISCNGGTSTLTVLASGGTGLLEYSLGNGIFQPGNIFNVIAGTYSVKVRLIANPSCLTSTATVSITQPNLFKASSSALPIYYCGGSTVVKVTATGGASPYTGTGSFEKGPGNWNFTITDAMGCIASTEVSVLPPGCVILRVSPNPAQNLITVNHSAALPASSIQIYAINGGMVLHKSVSQNAFSSTIDISTLASNIYLLVFINGKERKEIKFVKTSKY